MAPREIRGGGYGSVPRTVVHHKDLGEVQPPAVQICDHSLQGGRQPLLLVKGGDNDGNRTLQSRIIPWSPERQAKPPAKPPALPTGDATLPQSFFTLVFSS